MALSLHSDKGKALKIAPQEGRVEEKKFDGGNFPPSAATPGVSFLEFRAVCFEAKLTEFFNETTFGEIEPSEGRQKRRRSRHAVAARPLGLSDKYGAGGGLSPHNLLAPSRGLKTFKTSCLKVEFNVLFGKKCFNVIKRKKSGQNCRGSSP